MANFVTEIPMTATVDVINLVSFGNMAQIGQLLIYIIIITFFNVKHHCCENNCKKSVRISKDVSCISKKRKDEMHFFFIFLELKKTFFRSSANAIKLFSQLSLTMKQNKLECLSLTSFFTVHYKGRLTSHLLAREKCASLLCFISKMKENF
jgi:hypothetical protein